MKIMSFSMGLFVASGWFCYVSKAFSTTTTKRAFGRSAIKMIQAHEVEPDKYTIPDQPARFAKAKAENNVRVLDLEKIYKPDFVKGKTVLVTGGNRGVGLAVTKELVDCGANVIVTTRAPADIPGVKTLVSGVEMTDDECGVKLAKELKDQNIGSIDILINNAGYFYEPVEKVDTLNFKEELKMIDICAVGPLRISSGLYNAGLLKSGSKVVMITSQGGAIGWRTTQNPEGGDYGHHMSKAAANMMGVLLSQELKGKGICVTMLHPGFNKTDMTKKYSHIWEIEGAVDPTIGAKRVVHEVGRMYTEEKEMQGCFINCEDGMQIPW